MDLSPAAVVQRQLEAYNARDLEALLAVYAPDARQYEHPDRLLATGTEEMRARFAVRFAEPNLHATLLQRIVLDSLVIDHERITRTFPEGPGSIEMVATYEVRDGRITRAWFASGVRRLAAGT